MSEKSPIEIVIDRLTVAKIRNGSQFKVSTIETDLSDIPVAIKGTVKVEDKEIEVFWSITGKCIFPQNPLFDLIKSIEVKNR